MNDGTQTTPRTLRANGARRELRSAELTARRAGRVRIALAALGVCAGPFLPGMPSPWAFRAYLGLALFLQWLIERRLVRTTLRALSMGAIDVLFVTFLVQQTGSVTSPLPIVYVVIPALYATTTPRRRVALSLGSACTACYAIVVAAEQLGFLPYAPASHAERPGPMFALACVLLVAICSSVTGGLTAQLIAALGQANARLRTLSQQDELTGLYNRRYIMQRLDDELARLRRNPRAACVAMVDLDGFKRVNDEEGHDAGDSVLRAVSRALLRATRKSDVVARYGGDEFVILLANTNQSGALALGARILDYARDGARQACPAIPVAASIGVTVLRDGDDPAEVIRRVDERLYAAKRAGGDRVNGD